MAEIEKTMLSGPGETLANGRNNKGLSLEQVAEKLHLSVSVVKQLEINQFDDQIPDAFARGYLRNYAKLLSIDEEEVIASYTQLIGQSAVKNYYSPTKTVGNPSTKGVSSNQIIIALVAIVILLAGAIWYFAQSVESVDASPMPASSLGQNNSLASTAMNSHSSRLTATDNVSTESDSNIDVSSLSSESSGKVHTTSDVQPEVLAQQIAAQPATVIEIPTGFVESNEATLSFEFEDDCWVQVTDVNGEVLAVGLKTIGRQFEVSGVLPISVVLGKPDVVKISYNGSEVDLACFPANSTARFSLNSPLACEN